MLNSTRIDKRSLDVGPIGDWVLKGSIPQTQALSGFTPITWRFAVQRFKDWKTIQWVITSFSLARITVVHVTTWRDDIITSKLFNRRMKYPIAFIYIEELSNDGIMGKWLTTITNQPIAANNGPQTRVFPNSWFRAPPWSRSTFGGRSAHLANQCAQKWL